MKWLIKYLGIAESAARSWLWLIILFILLSGRESALADERFTFLTIKDGLSQSSIKAIEQDSYGYLWFGTADGLNSYDGYKITKYYYNPTEPNSIPSSDISCIYENPYDSVLWIGTQDAGPAIYNSGMDYFRSFAAGASNNAPAYFGHIKDMVATGRGSLWIAATNRGIYMFNAEDSTFIVPGFNEKPQFRGANCIEIDSKGDMWIGTSYGLFRWNTRLLGSEQEPQQVLLDDSGTIFSVSQIKFDAKGNLYIGTQRRGVIKYHPDSNYRTEFFMPHPSGSSVVSPVTDILVRMDGEIWISTPDGLYKEINRDGNFRVYRNNILDPESLNDNNITRLYEERSGIICIGTFMGGVNMMVPGRNRFPKYNNFISSSKYDPGYNHIMSIFTDDKNSVWINTLNGLLELKESYFSADNPTQHVIQHLSGSTAGSIMDAGEHGIFLSINGKISRLLPGGSLEPVTPIILEQTGVNIGSFTTGMVDSDGIIWLSTGMGLVRFDPESNAARILRIRINGGESIAPYALKMIESSDGKIFIGTYDGLLYSLDRHLEQFRREIPFDIGNDLINFTKIFTLAESEPGIIWIGTNCGLYSYNYKTRVTERFLDIDGLSNNLVYGILIDRQGKIWCSTNYGISVLDPETDTFRNYTYQDGLQSNEFNQESYYQSPDGTFYMGGIDGLNIFRPGEIEASSFSPPVHIERMEIQYKPVTQLTNPEILQKQLSKTSELTINYKQSTFSFEYTSLDFSQPTRNNFKYILEGYDEDWIEAGNRRIATYTNVPPGYYTFKVLGSNSDGLWNEVPASIAITIRPPFWRTLWFRISFILFSGALLYLIFYMRINSIKRQKELLEAKINEKTHRLVEHKNYIESQNLQLQQINIEITEKNKILAEQHQKILEQRDDMMKLTEEVQNSNQARLKFFTTISHEFSTPLTLIINPLKNIINNIAEFDKDHFVRQLKTVYGNTSRLLVLLNQLLDFRKVEVAKMQLHPEKIEFVSFIRQIVQIFNDLANQGNINLQMKTSHPELYVWADRLKIEKVMFNILSNAFKYIDRDGSITVRIKSSQDQNGEKHLILSVEDTGEGIEPEKIEFIFDRFYQGNSSGSTRYGGSGLGLAIAKDYIELHDGTISVKSEPGAGSTFYIDLPVDRHRNDNSVTAAPESNTGHTDTEILQASLENYIPINVNNPDPVEDRKKHSILIVEDDSSLNAFLKDILSVDYNVKAVFKGNEGLRIASSDSPDLILCDVVLPDLSGFEFCEKIRSTLQLSHIPVILLTSIADQDYYLKGLKCGADDYFTKPFDMEELIVKINNIIDARQRLRLRYTHSSFSPEGQFMDDDSRSFLDRAVECIESNISDTEFNVDEFCGKMGISHSQVYRKVKAITNLSISEFIRNERLKNAAKLLVSGQYKVNEVAYRVGFNDPNYFTKCFTTLYEQTPREYIKSFRK